MRSRVAGVRRRDRRGRGPRGPLIPTSAPASRTRAERFDDLVADEVRRLESRWGAELARVDFMVQDVPDLPVGYPEPPPLGVTEPVEEPPAADADGASPTVRIVVYRRPIESRADSEPERTGLIRDLLVEEVADLLGLAPESVDPSYEPHDDS